MRNLKRQWIATVVLSFMFLGGVSFWLAVGPVTMGSLSFWVGVSLLVVPACVAVESLGSVGLNSRIAVELPKSLRIGFGVIWIIFCMAIAGLVLMFLSEMVRN